ncbi:sugar ABC transporter substrate-binding protein [Enterococcus sp. JM4C]|uniref:sugar ABC transporter substrate-binding protein n=1 Tax=Candidatus Enterococcus huntleyi TaxID=1857217 RepID=UPI00137ABCFE|nr:sugar ABC transporter substrate-binding protein [Enterococcus sp. JM4C]KAF1297509.1 sugar ABC transporter substrate-binding protein [Enterococcus sp. JM4C]
MKKLFGSLLAVSVLLSLAACGGKEEKAADDFSIKDRYTLDETTPAWKQDKKEETTKIRWYINSDWTSLPFGEDVTTAQIKKDLNIDIEFISGDDSKLNAMISGGDMPDIVTLTDMTGQAAKKADSWALPLNDLAKKYDPYLMSVVNEDTFKWYALDNGKTYGYPNYSNTEADYEAGNVPVNDNFVIREDVYNALGKPDVSTPENFVKVMKEISEKYPDYTPMGFTTIGEAAGPFSDKLQDFLGVPLEDEDGKFYDRSMDEEYLEWLKTINQVYRDGNISDDSFTDDGATFDEKVKQGKYATMLVAGTSGQGGNFTEFMKNSGTQYIAIDGPSSTSGRKPTLNQTGISGWLSNYITKDAKDPAKVTQLFTYLIDEPGQILTKYGVEGVTYAYNDEGKIDYLDEVKEMEKTDNEAYNKKYGISRFLYFNNDRVNSLKVKQVSALTQMQEWGVGKLTPHFVIENTNPDAGTAEARSNEAIETKLNTTIVSLIRSKDEKAFDTTLNNFKDFLENNKWEAIKDIKSEKMAENKEKLN